MTTKEKLKEALLESNLFRFDTDLTDIIEAANSKDISPWRFGQYVFNHLYMSYPKVADAIRSTELDMFYIDEKTAEFVRVVSELMDELNNSFNKVRTDV